MEVAEYGALRDFVEAYTGDSPPPLLVFGDSVFLRVAEVDRSPQSLGENLHCHCHEAVCLISGSGYHSGVFEQFAAVLAKLSARPRIAVVPINLRSFSPTWDLNPLYQFRSEIELLSSFELNSQNYVLSDIVACPEGEGGSVVLECDGHVSITLRDFLYLTNLHPELGSADWKSRLKTIFQYHYAYPLRPEHRKLQSLKRTIGLLRELGVAVYSYVTPINYEAGREYVGESFCGAVEENISILRREILSGESLLPDENRDLMLRLDNFVFQFERDVFFTPHNATEHLRSDGREFIARRIIEVARPILQMGTY